MSKRRTRRPRQGRGRGHVNRDGLDTRLGARYVPTLAVPRPPDPRRTREYTYFGPRVAGGTFSPAAQTSRGGPGAGALRLSLGHGGEAPSHGTPVPGPLSTFRQIVRIARP